MGVQGEWGCREDGARCGSCGPAHCNACLPASGKPPHLMCACSLLTMFTAQQATQVISTLSSPLTSASHPPHPHLMCPLILILYFHLIPISRIHLILLSHPPHPHLSYPPHPHLSHEPQIRLTSSAVQMTGRSSSSRASACARCGARWRKEALMSGER